MDGVKHLDDGTLSDSVLQRWRSLEDPSPRRFIPAHLGSHDAYASP